MKYVLYSLLLVLCLGTSSVLAQDEVRQLSVEPNHSTIAFSISIAGFTKVIGKFTDYTIEIDWDQSNPSESKIETVIQAKSIQTGISDRDEHLCSADFFDVEKYPKVTFSSKSIKQVGDGFVAKGDFSMHGETHEIEIPFRVVKQDGNTIGFSGKTMIRRSDFDLGTGFKHTSMPDFLSDEVEVSLDFWTKKRKAKKDN